MDLGRRRLLGGAGLAVEGAAELGVAAEGAGDDRLAPRFVGVRTRPGCSRASRANSRCWASQPTAATWRSVCSK